jgi:hypothetical protein
MHRRKEIMEQGRTERKKAGNKKTVTEASVTSRLSFGQFRLKV